MSDCVSGEKQEKVLRVWVDGCFDMGHFGHVNLLRQAKEAEIVPGMKNFLVVGVHSDEEIAKHKRFPIFTENERLEMVRSCKYVDEVVSDAPYITTLETMEKHKCEYVIHGNDLSTSATGVDTYAEVKSAGKYYEVDRTEGISTTSLIKRVLQDETDAKGYTGGSALDDQYYVSLMEKIKNPDSKEVDTTRVVYVEGSFDDYHPGNIRFLKEAKSRGTYLIVNIYDDATVKETKGSQFPHMNLYERALTVMGNRDVDKVILGGNRVQILDQHENVKIFEGIDSVTLNLDDSLTDKILMEPTTDQIIERIKARREELMAKNAKKEAQEQEFVKNFEAIVKIA